MRRIVNNSRLLLKLRKELASSPKIAWDTETTGLHHDRRIVGWSVATPRGGWYVPLNHYQGGLSFEEYDNAPEELALEVMFEILTNPANTVYVHNYKFDLHSARNHGLNPEDVRARVVDTLTLSWLANPGWSNKLDVLVKDTFGYEMTSYKSLLKIYREPHKIPIAVLAPYAVDDVVWLLKLVPVLEAKVAAAGKQMSVVYEQLEEGFPYILERMENEGVKIDVPYLEQVGEDVREEMRSSLRELSDMVGGPVALGSPQWLARTFVDRLRWWGDAGAYGASGHHSTSHVWLEKWAAGSVPGTAPEGADAARRILRYRKLEMLDQRYTRTLIAQVDNRGRLHGSLNQHGTRTGRLSCLKEGSLLLSKQGYIPIEKLKVGDHVWTHLGRWRRVLASHSLGEHDSVAVGLSNGAEIVCTPCHRFRRTGGSWVRAEELWRGLRLGGGGGVVRSAAVPATDVFVTSVREAGKQRIFDITVEDDESYLCCGVFSHNSNSPNLQNIPGETEGVPSIRRAFIARDGFKLLCIDYSQVELRITAHFSGDVTLCEAFRAGDVDIHQLTGDRIGKGRKAGKTMNFAVLYGMGPHSIADAIGVPKEEGRRYLLRFFAGYPGVDRLITRTKEQARRDGFVTTIIGRRRYLPGIRSRDKEKRGASERRAFNTAVQGSAADIIKIAMRNVDRRLRKEGWFGRDAFQLIQVHDELLAEVRDDLADEVAVCFREELEGCVKLAVPLVAEPGLGANWAEAK